MNRDGGSICLSLIRTSDGIATINQLYNLMIPLLTTAYKKILRDHHAARFVRLDSDPFSASADIKRLMLLTDVSVCLLLGRVSMSYDIGMINQLQNV
jgi:hypothetical protein